MFYRDQRENEVAPWERHLYRNEALMIFAGAVGINHVEQAAQLVRRPETTKTQTVWAACSTFSEPQSIEMTLLTELVNILLIAEGYNIAPRHGWK